MVQFTSTEIRQEEKALNLCHFWMAGRVVFREKHFRHSLVTMVTEFYLVSTYFPQPLEYRYKHVWTNIASATICDELYEVELQFFGDFEFAIDL